MQRFWWVNHKQTVKQETDGRYLWSPKFESTKKGPKRSQFYNNMRRVSPGDLVLSYADGAVRSIGRVVEFAFTAPKPKEFGNAGSYWSDEGWLVPVFWVPLSTPVRPKTFISELGQFFPKKYSPMRASGDGNQKAYLSEIEWPVIDMVLAHTRYDEVALATGGANSLNYSAMAEQLDDDVEQAIAGDVSLESTVRQSLIDARRGQGRFRRNVEEVEGTCRLTGVSDPALLIASHIKPWRACVSAKERLDGMNGLLLTPDADLLFDRGLISFENNGSAIVSPRADRDDLRRLGLGHLVWDASGVAEAPIVWGANPFAPAQSAYLDYHRKQVFVSAA